jgi:hypothetical protein
MADDELQELRDNFCVGNYQKAIQISESNCPSNDFVQAENDAIYARCCLALALSGQANMMDKIKGFQNSDNPGQKATALMAMIAKTQKEQAKAQAKEFLIKLANETKDVTAVMLAAIITAQDGSYAEAVQMAQAHPTLEMQALCVFFALLCNQVGMAEQMVHKMAGNNDDSAAYRLASAGVKLATGDPEEAYLTYCDLSGQFPPAEGDDSSAGSVLLQTGKGVANMQRAMWSEALEDLQRAHTQMPSDPNVLVNLCSCDINSNKKVCPEFEEHYKKLKEVAPTHPYVVKTESISQVFERFKASQKA